MTKLFKSAAFAAAILFLTLPTGCVKENPDYNPQLEVVDGPCSDCLALTVSPNPGKLACGVICSPSFTCKHDDDTLANFGEECLDADASCHCVINEEINCVDDVDDDLDGDVDCDDEACADNDACAPPPVEACDDPDGNDEDDNGSANCDDPACADDPACVPPPVEVCDDPDGNDEDDNGSANCDDPACDDDPACVPPPVEVCDNGLDDDGDGFVDVGDDDCADQTVASFGLYLGVDSYVRIETAVEVWEGNIPGDFTLNVEIDGVDAFAMVWVETEELSVSGGGQGFIVWAPPESMAPPAFPVNGGLPVGDGGSFSATPNEESWFNLYLVGATE